MHLLAPNLIKLTTYDETKRRAQESQIDRAKEDLKLSHDGPSQRQATYTNKPIKVISQGRH